MSLDPWWDRKSESCQVIVVVHYPSKLALGNMGTAEIYELSIPFRVTKWTQGILSSMPVKLIQVCDDSSR